MATAPQNRLLDESKPVWMQLALFLIPLMLSSLLQSLGSSANGAYIGRLVGVHAFAAVSSIFPVVFFLVSFLIGLGSGATVLIGQAYGARDMPRVKAVAGTTLALTLLLGVVVGLAGSLFAYQLLALLGTPQDIIATATSYARIVFATLPILFTYLIYTTFLRGTGDVKTPFIALIGSTIATIAITPFFIVGAFGIPGMGANGAAVANVVASLCALAGLLVYLRRTNQPLALDREIIGNMILRPKIVVSIVRLGIPTGINLVMVSLSEIAVISFVNHFGSTASAAYGAVNQVVSYVQFPAISLGIAASIFSSQAIGAQMLERIPRIVRAAVLLNYAIEGFLILIAYLLAAQIIGVFVQDPATEAIARRLLGITLWSYAIFGNARVLANIMLSSGAVLWPTTISILSIWGVEVPVAYVLSQRIGLDGVWYGYPAAFIAGLAAQYAYYALVWLKSPKRRL